MQNLLPHRVHLPDHVLEIVSAHRQERQRQHAVILSRIDFSAVVELGADELPLASGGEGDDLAEAVGGVESLGARLQDGERVDELLASHFEGVDDVDEGEHVVEVLILQNAGHPRGPEPTSIQDDCITSWHGSVHEVGDQIAQIALGVVDSCHVDLALDDFLEVGRHQRKPLLSVERLQSAVLPHSLPVEVPVDQLSSRLKLAAVEVAAGAQVLEDAFADGNWAFNEAFVDLAIVEAQVEDVEVVAAVYGANHRHALDEVVRELMAMPLNHSIHCPCGKCLQKHANLIGIRTTAALRSVLIPNSEGAVGVAVVADVAEDDDCVGSSPPEDLAAFEDDGSVFQELVGREGSIVEGAGGRGSLNSGQTDDSDLHSRSHFVYSFAFLQRQEVLLSIL